MVNLMWQERKELMKKTQRGDFHTAPNSFAMLDPMLDPISMLDFNALSNAWSSFNAWSNFIPYAWSNSEVLLLCLWYVIFYNNKPKTCETFLDSLYTQRRPSGHTIRNSILSLLQRNNIDISNMQYWYCTSMQCCKCNEQWQLRHCICLKERATISWIHAL